MRSSTSPCERCGRPPTPTRPPAARRAAGIYPVVATIDADGWSRLDDETPLASRYEAIVAEVRSR
jgi:hypothetical protein